MALSPFIRVGLRIVQLLFSVTALVLLAFSFRTESRFGRVTMLGSPTATLAMLTSYSALLHSFFRLVAGEPRTTSPSLQKVLRAVELSLTLALLAAGLLLTKSSYVVDCDLYQETVHCTRLETATTFLFIAHAACVGSIALARSHEKHDDAVENKAPDEDAETLLAKTHHE